MNVSVYYFVIACLLINICLVQVAVSSSIVEKVDDNEAEEKPFDWSKPVVSRGFGLEAPTENDELWVNQYKSGQVSYFFGEYSNAFDKWLPLAEKNYAEAQASIAWLFQSGLGVAKDISKALRYYRLAAEQDHATAQNNLGVMYEQGLGVEKNLSTAREWYRKSAEQGYRFAEFNYANFLYNGLGGEKDPQLALKWYRKAADQDVAEAKKKLSELTPELIRFMK